MELNERIQNLIWTIRVLIVILVVVLIHIWDISDDIELQRLYIEKLNRKVFNQGD